MSFDHILYNDLQTVIMKLWLLMPAVIHGYLCLVHICPGRRAINLSTIFRAIFGHCITLRAIEHCAVSFYGASGATRGKHSDTNCEKIVRKSCNCQCSCRAKSETIRTEIKRGREVAPSHGAPAGIVQLCPPTTYLRAICLDEWDQICPTSRKNANRNAADPVDENSVQMISATRVGRTDKGERVWSFCRRPIASQMWTRLLMPSSHLRRVDKFVYEYVKIFGAQIGATGYGVCVHIVYGHRAISSTEGLGGNPG